MSVFNKNTRRVLSYDVLRQQKMGIMTKGGLTSLRLRRITNACRRSLRLCFSHFATRTVDNTVDLYAAKPDIRSIQNL